MERKEQEKELLEKARHYLPGGQVGNTHFDHQHQFLAHHARGSHLWDVSGNEYLDYQLGSGPMVLGHCHPAVVDAVKEAVDGGSTFFVTNHRAVMLAEEVVRAVPCADQVRFTTSGTEANFQALRVARAFRQKDKILKFEGGYHGTSDYTLISVTPEKSADYLQPVPNTAGIPKAVQDLVLIAPFNDAETAASIIDEHHRELAAVIMEPLQRLIPPRPGFLQSIRDVTALHGIPLIFDEVVTGFRLAYGGAQNYYGVIPDLATYGKILGGGYPLAAVCGREDIMSVYDIAQAGPGGFVNQVGTLNANPISCAAGLATLAELRKDGVYEKLHAIGRKVRKGLQQVCDEANIPAQVLGEDCVFDVYFTDRPIFDYRDTLTNNSSLTAAFNSSLLERGILKPWPFKMYVSLAHTEKDVDQTIDVFTEVISELKK